MIKNWKHSLVLIASCYCFSEAYGQSAQEAQRATDQENFDGAIKAYRNLLANDRNERNYYALGNAYIQTEKLDSAALYFKQALAEDKKSAINMVGMGKVELMRGNKAAADQHFNDALKRSRSKDTFVLNEIARAYLDAKAEDLNVAVERLQASLKRDNKNPETHLLLGDVYLAQNKGGDAMNSYERALQLNPKLAKAQVRRGQLYMRSRNSNEANAAFQAAQQIDASYAPTYREWGDLYLLVGKPEDAAQMYQKYIDMAGSSTLMQYKYATALYSNKQFAEAHQEIEKALRADPNNIGMQRLRAFTHYEAGENEKAMELMSDYFNKTQAKPDQRIIDDYKYYGNILAKAGETDKAVNMLQQAIQMDPENAGALHDVVAMVHYRNKNYAGAVAAYKKKMEKGEPDLADYFRIGDAYYWMQDYQKSDSLFAVITERSPQYGPAHLYRARNNYFLDPEGAQGLAKPHYEKYIEVAQADPQKNMEGLVEAHKYLAAYHEDKKEPEISRQHWEAVIAIDPENADAKAALTPAKKPARSNSARR